MNSYHYHDPRGNVGDDLNKIIIPYYFSDTENQDSTSLLVGIGTLINNKLPDAGHYIFFTTGYGYQKPPLLEGKKVSAIGFRGPLTYRKIAKYLDSDSKDIPLIDGAYLTPEIIKIGTQRRSSVATGLIPHVDSIDKGLWSIVAQQAGYKLIDPRLRPEEFIKQIGECKQVITEAMHGAILADAYRIPWTPYYAYDHINHEKWKDWGDSLSLKIDLEKVTPIYKGNEHLRFIERSKDNIKHGARMFKLYNDKWTPPLPRRSSMSVIDKAVKQLKKIETSQKFQLSNELTVQSKLEHLKENIFNFTKRNY